MTAAASPAPSGPAAREAHARRLLERAHAALLDADLLGRSGAGSEGAALLACEAAHLAARALLAPLDLDRVDPAAATLLLDARLVATDRISRACGEALHRALRARREVAEAEGAGLYAARLRALRDGAALLVAEADILLGREGPAPSVPPPADDEEALE